MAEVLLHFSSASLRLCVRLCSFP